ncbi:unnamed protein product, partial [Rotaria magnacalcarata]
MESQPLITNNSKRRNRLKSTNTTTTRRNRNRKSILDRPNSTGTIASCQQETTDKPSVTSPITPT